MSVSNRAELEQFLQDSYARDPLVQFRLSGGEEPDASGSVRHEIRPVEIRNQVQLQWTSIDAGGRQTHQNSDWPSSLEKILALFGQPFRNLLVRLPEEDWQIGLDRKNRFRVQKHRTSPKTKPVSSSHDTSRQYLLPEGQPIPFLVELGVMTPEGKVRAAQQKKFRQINRFLEFLADVKDRFPTDRVMQVIDYGCGKSYLTFAVREYLVQKLGLQVEIHAYDSNSGIIDECEKVRGRLQIEDIHFHKQDVNQIPADHTIDLAICLHACDTATDAALGKSMAMQAEVILSVPCCQHELHHQLEYPLLNPLLKHGILRERFAALLTDSLRALGLESQGYKTQVIEFIDTEHTPKNLLLRAVRTSARTEQQNREAREQLDQVRNAFGIQQFALEQYLIRHE